MFIQKWFRHFKELSRGILQRIQILIQKLFSWSFPVTTFFLRRTMPLYAHNLQYHRLQKQRPLTLIWHVEKASNPLKVLNFCGDFFSNIHLSSNVTNPKYSKHWPYMVAYTIDCVCSKMLNHGLNHGLFLSLFNLIHWHIHWILYVYVSLFKFQCLNFKAVLALPRHIKV